MDYYVERRQMLSGIADVFWAVDEKVAHQDIYPSTHGTFTANEGEDILQKIRDLYPTSEWHKLALELGEYYPRMARPGHTGPGPGSNMDQSQLAKTIQTISTGQLDALIQELKRICRVIHPVPANFQAYGHEIRNLLIIACTEVEAQWKSIMKANHAKAESRFDYVKLSDAMKLREYRVSLPWYPWLEPVAPFLHWKPTAIGEQQILPWYDAYNAVKHNREDEFSKGTLEHTISALAGCFVMLCAQYGQQFARKSDDAGDAFFLLLDVPTWEPNELYLGGGEPKPKDYPFP